MSYVTVGVICAVLGFGGGFFVAVRYDITTDYLVEKYHSLDGKFDFFVDRIAAWIKGLF